MLIVQVTFWSLLTISFLKLFRIDGEGWLINTWGSTKDCHPRQKLEVNNSGGICLVPNRLGIGV